METETPAARRIRRELKTVRVMIALYCRERHGGGRDLCEDCRALWEYTQQRVERCRFGDGKPTCVNCPVHCFKPDRRDDIRRVMRYAGPRMALRHPLLSVLHVIDGRRAPRPLSKRAG